MKTFQDCSLYNALYWAPNGSRSKRQFQYKLQTVQRTLNDSRQWIRVLSSETIVNLKKNKLTKFKFYKLIMSSWYIKHSILHWICAFCFWHTWTCKL